MLHSKDINLVKPRKFLIPSSIFQCIKNNTFLCQANVYGKDNVFQFQIFDPPTTGNVGGIFGRPFSFFSPAAREGKVVVVVGCPAHLSNVASGQTIMISNSQTFKAQNSGKTGASHRPEKRRRPGCLVFLATSHGGRQRKHLSQVAPYGRKWARIK